MSRHFSFKRFGLLFKKHISEQGRGYLMSFVVLTGLLALIMVILVMASTKPIDVKMQEFVYAMPFLLAGAIFTSNVFAALGDKKKAIATLMLPASHFEKYLLGWIFSFFIYMIMYTISYYLVLYVVLQIGSFQGQEMEFMNIFSNNLILGLMLGYSLVHAVALVGAVYFEKAHFIKTAFIFFIFMLLLVFLNKLILGYIFGQDVDAFPLTQVSFMENENRWTVVAPDAFNVWIQRIVPLLMTVLLWVAAYARLREKQV